jgi:tRNA(adenine34) deaminase
MSIPEDAFFMREALLEAQRAADAGEVPVGAILVKDGKIIARACNAIEKMQDASMHAEMECMRHGAEHLGNWRLLGCTLYSTLEPCSMCAGAMFLFRLERLVWGARDVRHGAQGSWVDLFSKEHPTHAVKITSGVLAEECGTLMRTFFQQRRLNHAR